MDNAGRQTTSARPSTELLKIARHLRRDVEVFVDEDSRQLQEGHNDEGVGNGQSPRRVALETFVQP